MKLSELLANFQPTNFWLWYPAYSLAIEDIKENGLVTPFLFEKKKSAASIRFSSEKTLLRINRLKLDEYYLIKDPSIDYVITACKNQRCWWDGDFKRWLQSLPLKKTDVIASWANNNLSPNRENKTLISYYLREIGTLWRYDQTIPPEAISLLTQEGYYRII